MEVLESSTPSTAAKCYVCGNTAGRTHSAREMMYGTRESFSYFECSDCGCLALLNVPQDLGKYYPAGYYSLQASTPWRSNYRSWLRKLLTAGVVFRIPLLHSLRELRCGPSPQLESLSKLGARRGMTVLDVGSGTGSLLYLLREIGVKAQGVDPYVTDDISDQFGPRVLRCELSELQGRWDLITFHHALEHMSDHRSVLEVVRARLTPEGRCLVRIPIVNRAWAIYGTDWIQLDAPRHLMLHSIESFRRLAAQAGFVLESFYCDSTAFQFWGSELYRKDIPLREGGLHLFTKKEVKRFKTEAGRLNRKGEGDQAAFILRPAQSDASQG